MFVHGLGGCKTHFEQAFIEAPPGMGILAVDLPGFGESDRFPPGVEYSFENHSAALSEVLVKTAEECGVATVFLTMHSMSSGILPELLVPSFPSLSGVALLEGNIIPEDAFWSKRIVKMGDAEFLKYFSSLQNGGHYALAAELKAQRSPSELKYLAACYSLADYRAFRETASHALAVSTGGLIAKALKSFSGPKLYFRGSESPTWTGWPLLLEAGVSWLTIENAAHFPHLDNPKQTYSSIYVNH